MTVMALIEFFVGYPDTAIHDGGAPLPLASAREERQAVVRSGFNAKTHFNIIENVRSQLHHSRNGLEELGTKPDVLNILEKRLENRHNNGQYVARLFQSKKIIVTQITRFRKSSGTYGIERK